MVPQQHIIDRLDPPYLISATCTSPSHFGFKREPHKDENQVKDALETYFNGYSRLTFTPRVSLAEEKETTSAT